jgi:hypothetical protein
MPVASVAAFVTPTIAVPRSYLGHAVYVWSILQSHQRSVSEAADAFNVPVEMIIASVEGHPGVSLYGDTARPAQLVLEHRGW